MLHPIALPDIPVRRIRCHARLTSRYRGTRSASRPGVWSGTGRARCRCRTAAPHSGALRRIDEGWRSRSTECDGNDFQILALHLAG